VEAMLAGGPAVTVKALLEIGLKTPFGSEPSMLYPGPGSLSVSVLNVAIPLVAPTSVVPPRLTPVGLTPVVTLIGPVYDVSRLPLLSTASRPTVNSCPAPTVNGGCASTASFVAPGATVMGLLEIVLSPVYEMLRTSPGPGLSSVNPENTATPLLTGSVRV